MPRDCSRRLRPSNGMTLMHVPTGNSRPPLRTATLTELLVAAETGAVRAATSWLRDRWRTGIHCSGEISFAVGVSMTWVVAYNGRFWRQVAAAMWHPEPRSVAFMASIGALLIVLHSTLLLIMPSTRLMRAFASILFVVAAASAYFIGAYGVMLDPDMMRNALQTDAAEIAGLANDSMLLHVLVLGVLPAVLLWRVHWPVAAPALRLRRRCLFLAAAWAVALLGVLGTSANYAVLLRQHKPVRYAALPIAPLVNTGRLLAREWSELRTGPLLDRGGKARFVGAAHPRPLVVLLVVGESARAASFQLGGYERPTNPRLRQVDDLLYFDHVQACGTSTAISVPCMFSSLGKDRFDADEARHYMNLLDTLQRAGLDVEWWDNNSGCKGVCARVPTVEYGAHRTAALCPESYCYDEIMLEDLRRRLPRIRRDTVIVFHQIGSHGPAYSERYPAAFELFRPSCLSSELHHCTAEELRNAYDNTILYTDALLARQIEILGAAQDRLDTLLLYVSDHGESLGEQGLYLHGLPYALAPRTQTEVPLLAWVPDTSRARLGLDEGCLDRRTQVAASHDDVYHTVLALAQLRDDAYDQRRDLLAPCRRPVTPP